MAAKRDLDQSASYSKPSGPTKMQSVTPEGKPTHSAKASQQSKPTQPSAPARLRSAASEGESALPGRPTCDTKPTHSAKASQSSKPTHPREHSRLPGQPRGTPATKKQISPPAALAPVTNTAIHDPNPPLPPDKNWAYEGDSALAFVFKRPDQGFHRLWFDGSLAELARCREELDFPGIEGVDTAFWHEGRRYWVRCSDSPSPYPDSPLAIRYSPFTRRVVPIDAREALSGAPSLASGQAIKTSLGGIIAESKQPSPVNQEGRANHIAEHAQPSPTVGAGPVGSASMQAGRSSTQASPPVQESHAFKHAHHPSESHPSAHGSPASERAKPQTEHRNKTWQPDEQILRQAEREPHHIAELAIFASRYLSAIHPGSFHVVSWPHDPRAEQLRRTLELVITGPYAHLGLQILYNSGWIDHYLPELSDMHNTKHSKEEHPEGDVWVHSLETLKYRKSFELDLSLGLLLHDCGKPDATPRGNRVFDGHAEIGADKARSILRRLDFAPELVHNVCWLVENHMMPQALSILPLYRTEKLMGHELFPMLLELYRCDLVSTWRGPDGYYDACTRFRAWLKASRNPWISLDRKRLIQRFVASSHS